jgi:hypothetical protein
MKLLPYIIKSGKNGMAVVVVEGKIHLEISAKVLAKIKADASIRRPSRRSLWRTLTIPAPGHQTGG